MGVARWNQVRELAAQSECEGYGSHGGEGGPSVVRVGKSDGHGHGSPEQRVAWIVKRIIIYSQVLTSRVYLSIVIWNPCDNTSRFVRSTLARILNGENHWRSLRWVSTDRHMDESRVCARLSTTSCTTSVGMLAYLVGKGNPRHVFWRLFPPSAKINGRVSGKTRVEL